MKRIGHKRRVVLADDCDVDDRGREAALTITDLVGEAVGARLANTQVHEYTVGILDVGAVGIQRQQRTGGQGNFMSNRRGVSIYCSDAQQIGIGATVVVVGED